MNIKTSATCFGPLSHHEAKIQNIRGSTDTFSECTHYVPVLCFVLFGLMLAQ